MLFHGKIRRSKKYGALYKYMVPERFISEYLLKYPLPLDVNVSHRQLLLTGHVIYLVPRPLLVAMDRSELLNWNPEFLRPMRHGGSLSS